MKLALNIVNENENINLQYWLNSPHIVKVTMG